MNAATWNLAYRNRRMRRSVLRAVIDFAGSPAMSHYPPAGFWSLAVGQVGGVLSSLPQNATEAVHAGEARCLPDEHTGNCLQDVEIGAARNMRDAA